MPEIASIGVQIGKYMNIPDSAKGPPIDPSKGYRIQTLGNGTTFSDQYTLKIGSQSLQLCCHGNGHEPGNIFVYAPKQKTLMVVDVIFPGWMMWLRLALAQDMPGYFAQVERNKSIDFDTLVFGHVTRTGTKADVELQSEFINDLKTAAGQARHSTSTSGTSATRWSRACGSTEVGRVNQPGAGPTTKKGAGCLPLP